MEVVYTIYLDGMCSCGWPMMVCRDPENDGWFELPERTTVCNVQAVIDREAAERRSNAAYEPVPGEILNVILTREDADMADSP